MCETEQQIRQWASEGKSKKQVMALLGVSERSLRDILEYLPDVKFFMGSVHEVRGVRGNIKYLIEHFGVDLSIRVVTYRIEQGMSPEDALFTPQMTRRKTTVRGFSGHYQEIIDHFGLSTNVDRVGKLIRRGQTPEQAFFGS